MSGTETPHLLWLDGTPTQSRIRVHPFNVGDDQITVEVLSEEETWVDFNYVGTESGRFNFPYRTLGKGVTNAAWGGILNFKPGSSSETQTIVKPLTFKAPLGTVTIGQ